MKIVFIILLALTICSVGYCEPVYIYIEKNGYVEQGQEAGMSAKGDVVCILPIDREPTLQEIAYYDIIKADIGEEEKGVLMMPVFKGDVGGERKIQRKVQVEYENLLVKDHKESVTSAKLSENITIKPVAIDVIE